MIQSRNVGIALLVLLSSIEVHAKEGDLLVRRKPGVSMQNMHISNQAAGATSIVSFLYPSGLELVRLKKGVSVEEALKRYDQDPNVLYAEKDAKWHAVLTPDDTLFSSQWGLHNVEQTGGKADADVNAPLMWETTQGSSSVAILIVDTGIDNKHPELKNSMWINVNEIPNNGKDDDDNGYVDDVHGVNAINNTGNQMDDNEHGTHVAGIIAAEGNNHQGVVGMMQRAALIGCKFLDRDGSGDTSGAIKCLDYAAKLAKREKNPVTIVASNNSWAGGPYSQALYDAIQAQQQLGILFIAAASNEGNNNDVRETYPANFGASNVISVAASTHKDRLASFSNYGRRSVSVAAPGEDILSTIPGGKYDYLSGTSMAAPFVSGLAGLIKSAGPSLTWIQIKNLILSGGTRIVSAQNTTISGRRIRGFDEDGTGSLSCHNQKVASRLLPKTDSVKLKLGHSLPLAFLSINCDQPAEIRSVSVETPDSGTRSLVDLKDDGKGLDEVKEDGIFSATFQPPKKGTYTLRFPDSKVRVIVN